MAREECVCVCVCVCVCWDGIKRSTEGKSVLSGFFGTPRNKKNSQIQNWLKQLMRAQSTVHQCGPRLWRASALCNYHCLVNRSPLPVLSAAPAIYCYTPRRTSRGGWAGERRYVTPAISPPQTTGSKGASDLGANWSGESQPRRGRTEGWGTCEHCQNPRCKKQKNVTN